MGRNAQFRIEIRVRKSKEMRINAICQNQTSHIAFLHGSIGYRVTLLMNEMRSQHSAGLPRLRPTRRHPLSPSRMRPTRATGTEGTGASRPVPIYDFQRHKQEVVTFLCYWKMSELFPGKVFIQNSRSVRGMVRDFHGEGQGFESVLG